MLPFLSSISSIRYSGPSFRKGKEIMPSHNSLWQKHLKKCINRLFNQHDRQFLSYNRINGIIGIHVDKYEWTGGWTWETIHDVTTISFHFCDWELIAYPFFYFRSLVMKLYFSLGCPRLYSLHEAKQSMQSILTCALSRPSSESCSFTRIDQRQ